MLNRFLLFTASSALLAGCSCNNEYTFDPYVGINSGEAPLDHGAWLSMDVAPDGKRLVVAYYDRGMGALGFAVGEPGPNGVAWSHEEIDGYPDDDGLDRGDRGKFASMKVAQDGTVWVAYYNVSQGTLWAAQRTGKEWLTQMVDAGSGSQTNAGQWCSLAIGADSQPRIAYQDKVAGSLKVARRLEDGSWSTTVAYQGLGYTGPNDAGDTVIRLPGAEYMDLVIDGNTEYVAFYDPAYQTLNLLEGFSGTYAHTVVHAAGNAGQWPSLLVDEATVYIAYHDVGNQDLRLATREGSGTFTSSMIDSGEFRGADTALFLRDGHPGIVYFDGHDNDMLLAQFNGSGWEMQHLGGEEAAVGFHNEVVQLGDGTWYAGSYNYTDKNLFLITLD